MNKDKRILIVDSNREFASVLSNDLLMSGYKKIESVNEYKDAITRLRQDDFDIVLVDLFAPDLRGIDYVRKIRRLKPRTRTFLMIEPELQPVVNGKVKGKIKSDCLLKSDLAHHLAGNFKG